MPTFKEVLDRCERQAAAQLGVISAEQCAAAGLSRRSIQRLVRRGEWQRVLSGVYMPRPVPPSWWTAAKAATLWGGQGCVLSGEAAARARRLDGFDNAEVQVATPLDRKCPALTVHRYPVLPLEPSTIIRSIPVIRAESMVFEICRSSSYRRARKVVGQLVREGVTQDRNLEQLMEAIGGKGLAGTRWLRAILDERQGIALEAETDAEIEFARLAARWGWDPIPQFKLRIDGRLIRRFDFAFPSRKLGIEIDGGIHIDIGITLEDREKDELARAAGWIVLRFKDKDVWYRPHFVHDSLSRVLGPASSLGR